MSTKFFNNTVNNTLFDKLKGIASEMVSFDRFLAVVGFFVPLVISSCARNWATCKRLKS